VELQGARLTVWELQQDGIDATLIADAAGLAPDEDREGAVGHRRRGPHLRQRRYRQQDRHLSAGHRRAPPSGSKFMVVAPSSTVDMATASARADRDRGARYRASSCRFKGARTVAEGVRAWNPVFDVTPHDLIDAIVTELGVVERPDAARMQALA
jgi:methylthioribose-1-phosphate isomerase